MLALNLGGQKSGPKSDQKWMAADLNRKNHEGRKVE